MDGIKKAVSRNHKKKTFPCNGHQSNLAKGSHIFPKQKNIKKTMQGVVSYDEIHLFS
jgi:hypothetical protein